MSFPDNEYRQGARYETQGGLGTLGIRTLIYAPENELTPEVGRILTAHTDAMVREIQMAWAKADPEGQAKSQEWKDALLGCFLTDTYELGPVRFIPNGYCSGACCIHKPWLSVMTKRGPITIGPRKRVIQISWTDAIPFTADDLFPNENVTKDGRMIHAWGIDKAREYVRVLQTTPIPARTP